MKFSGIIKFFKSLKFEKILYKYLYLVCFKFFLFMCGISFILFLNLKLLSIRLVISFILSLIRRIDYGNYVFYVSLVCIKIIFNNFFIIELV